MNQFKKLMLIALLAAFVVGLTGCGGDDDSITIEQAKAKAEKMDVDQLKKEAIKYKDKIAAKQKDAVKLMEDLKSVPITEAMGDKAKAIKEDMGKITESVQKLTEIYNVYLNKMKEKGGDPAGVEL